MRAEDQLKAEEEEEVQEIVQGLAEGRDDEQAEEAAEEHLPQAARHFNSVVLTMRSVLEGRAVGAEQLAELSMDERVAVEVLEQVVSARGRRGGFIFAEARLERLNQVLAVLQPALSIGNAPGVEQLNGELAVVIDEVAHLREKLINLDAAEEELTPVAEDREAEGDKDDDDDDDDEGAGEVPEPGAPPRPSILSTGPAVPDRVSPPSTLATGPAAPERKAPPTTLIGSPAAPDLPVRPSTLVGSPEAPDFAPPPSTLGDVESPPAPAPAAGRPSPPAAGEPAPTPPKPTRARKVK